MSLALEAQRRANSEASKRRLASLKALEGMYPQFEEITHHNLEHLYNVLSEIRPSSGGYEKAIDLVQRKEDGLICIRKTFKLASKRAKPRRWLREVKAVRALDHMNIERYFEAAISPYKGEIFLELCDLGNLAQFRMRMATAAYPAPLCPRGVNLFVNIPEPFVWHVFKSLTSALTYMQCGLTGPEEFLNENNFGPEDWYPILHRDIKLDNVFLKATDRPGEYPIIKLGDFGMGVSKKDLLMPFATSGTEGWMAPEFPNCSTRSDLYSATAVIQCLTTRDWREAKPTGGVGRGYSFSLSECVFLGMQKKKADRPRPRELAEIVFCSRGNASSGVDIPDAAYTQVMPPKELLPGLLVFKPKEPEPTTPDAQASSDEAEQQSG